VRSETAHADQDCAAVARTRQLTPALAAAANTVESTLADRYPQPLAACVWAAGRDVKVSMLG